MGILAKNSANFIKYFFLMLDDIKFVLQNKIESNCSWQNKAVSFGKAKYERKAGTKSGAVVVGSRSADYI